MINRCFIQNCIHILVGFYLPTTFLSSLFQQVVHNHSKPSQPFNDCFIQVCISCTRLLRTSCNTFILTQRFITYHRFHSLTTLHNKLFHKLSLHISCYAQQARTVYHRSKLSPPRQAITAHLILLYFNCRSHSSSFYSSCL